MLSNISGHIKRGKTPNKIDSEDEQGIYYTSSIVRWSFAYLSVGRTSLHLAAAANNYSKAKTLLKKGANIMDIDNKGWNALHVAAEAANYKIVQLFLSRKG